MKEGDDGTQDHNHEISDDVPDEINLPEQKGQMYWYEMWRDLRIVTKAPKEKKEADKRRTGEERAGKKVEGNKRDFEGKCLQKEGIYCRNYLWKNPGS